MEQENGFSGDNVDEYATDYKEDNKKNFKPEESLSKSDSNSSDN